MVAAYVAGATAIIAITALASTTAANRLRLTVHSSMCADIAADISFDADAAAVVAAAVDIAIIGSTAPADIALTATGTAITAGSIHRRRLYHRRRRYHRRRHLNREVSGARGRAGRGGGVRQEGKEAKDEGPQGGGPEVKTRGRSARARCSRWRARW